MPIPNEPPTDKTSGPVTSTQTPEEIAKESELLRERVDALEIKAAERETPWYEQPSLVLSIFAVAISFAFSALGVYYRNKDVQKADTEADVALVRKNIMALAEDDTWLIEAKQRYVGNLNIFLQLDRASHSKRQLLIEETDSLVKTLKGHLSATEYLNFGRYLASDDRTADAFAYYRIALGLAKNNEVAKRAVFRAMAVEWMKPGLLTNPDSGRHYWREDLKSWNRQTSPYSIYVKADILSTWRWEELTLGNTHIADSLKGEARATAKGLPRWSTLRQKLDPWVTAPDPSLATATPVS